MYLHLAELLLITAWIVLKWKCFWQLNCVLMLNWTVFNRTDYLHKMDLALNNLQRLICHKTKQTKPNPKFPSIKMTFGQILLSGNAQINIKSGDVFLAPSHLAFVPGDQTMTSIGSHCFRPQSLVNLWSPGFMAGRFKQRLAEFTLTLVILLPALNQQRTSLVLDFPVP